MKAHAAHVKLGPLDVCNLPAVQLWGLITESVLFVNQVTLKCLNKVDTILLLSYEVATSSGDATRTLGKLQAPRGT